MQTLSMVNYNVSIVIQSAAMLATNENFTKVLCGLCVAIYKLPSSLLFLLETSV